jgi:hypothetical protein
MAPLEFDETVRLNRRPTRESFVRPGTSEIFVVDWSGASAAEVRESMARVRETLSKRNGRKVLMLVDITGTRWDAKLPFECPAWVAQISPTVGRLAIVGIAGLQHAILSGLRSLTRQPLLTFATLDEANAWLTRPRRRDTGVTTPPSSGAGPGFDPDATITRR